MTLLTALAPLVACTPTDPGPDRAPPAPAHSATPPVEPPPAHTGEGHTAVMPWEPQPSPGCTDPDLTGGAHTLDVGGVERSYLVQLAADPAVPAPLVLDFHGTAAEADDQRRLSGLDAIGLADGWTIAWPESQGSGATKAFRLTCQGADVDFAAGLIEHLGGSSCVDLGRVYVTGISNGGYFSNVLAAVLPGVVRAAAPVSGGVGLMGAACPPSVALPVTLVHGADDDFVPPTESEAAFALWLEVAECASTELDAEGCQVGVGCLEPVRYCSAPGAHHVDIYQRYDTAERIRELVSSVP